MTSMITVKAAPDKVVFVEEGYQDPASDETSHNKLLLTPGSEYTTTIWGTKYVTASEVSFVKESE